MYMPLLLTPCDFAATRERLARFGLSEEVIAVLLSGDISTLPHIIKDCLLESHDVNIKVHVVRAACDTERFNEHDVVVLDDGLELSIYWKGCCLKLR